MQRNEGAAWRRENDTEGERDIISREGGVGGSDGEG